jgi:hypothetical protein
LRLLVPGAPKLQYCMFLLHSVCYIGSCRCLGVSLRLLMTESWTQYQANPRESYGVKSDIETGLFPLPFHQCPIPHSFIDLRPCIILAMTAGLNKTLTDSNSPLLHCSAVAQLFKDLPYKPKGHGFYSRWRHLNCSLI